MDAAKGVETMLTEAQIRPITGPLEPSQILAIIKTGAREEHVREAVVWLNTEGELSAARARNISPVARQIVDILSADAPPEPDEL